MKEDRAAVRYERSPGERAFDRCFLPLAAFLVLNVIVEWITWYLRPPRMPRTEAQLAAEMPPPPPPPWHAWLTFAIGLLLAVLWVRALVSLLSAWHDPSSRVLRFAASVLLIPFALIIYRLLLTPFQ